jgi:hypothetical protein
MTTPTNKKPQVPDTTDKKWATFTYFNPKVRKITNTFKDTRLYIAFRPTNTIFKYTKEISMMQKDLEESGIYEILCHTRVLKYEGQTSRDLTTRFSELQSKISICTTHTE